MCVCVKNFKGKNFYIRGGKTNHVCCCDEQITAGMKPSPFTEHLLNKQGNLIKTCVQIVYEYTCNYFLILPPLVC